MQVGFIYDGFSPHKPKKVQQVIEGYGWTGLLNVAYSWQDNPMEYLLNDVKHAFRKLTLLQAIPRSNDDSPQMAGIGKLFEQAFVQIPD